MSHVKSFVTYGIPREVVLVGSFDFTVDYQATISEQERRAHTERQERIDGLLSWLAAFEYEWRQEDHSYNPAYTHTGRYAPGILATAGGQAGQSI